MTKLTASQTAAILGVVPREVCHLIKMGHLKAEKIDPSKKNSSYLIAKREIERYQQAPKSSGKAPKRCEPCNHSPKKLCASCKLLICIKDYRFTQHGMPAARCKDCENKRKKARVKLA
jgi:hypothetical protein